MIRTIALLFVLFASLQGQAQYTVTKVVGTVKNLTRGEVLKTGSKMAETDKIQFSSANDLVRMIVLGKGAYVIQANPRAVQQENTILEILKSSLGVKSKEGYLSGRAGNFETIPDAFETEADRNTHTLLLPSNRFLLDTDRFPTGSGSRFFLQVTANGKTDIKPLRTQKDTLFLNHTDFEITAGTIDPKASYQLGYYSAEEQSSKALATLLPYFDRNNEMETLMQALAKEGKNLSAEILEKELYKEVYEALGKPSDIEFARVLKKVSGK